MSSSELTLDRELALALQISPALSEWLIGRTKFKAWANTAKLLHNEQAEARTAPFWWKHWWCRIPGYGDSETDVFLVFEHLTVERFALHIENKLASGSFTKNQADLYAIRAEFMKGKPRWLNYTDFATVLLAPQSFRMKFITESQKFDHFIAHEELASLVPAYGP